jgi:SRSO17 transposase
LQHVKKTFPPCAALSDPVRWGLPAKAVDRLGTDLHTFWERYHGCFRTRTRDTSENALWYWRGQLTMEDARNFANIERRLHGGDGQALQQFMSDSPWEAQGVYQQIQADLRAHPALQVGGALILDECADEKAGEHSAGAGRQHNGRLGKNEMSQVVTSLVFAHLATGTWVLVDVDLFLPEAWFTAEAAERRRAAGVPASRTFATKPELGLRMILRAQAQGLPFAFVAGDDLYGKSRAFRAGLDAAQLQYAVDVPSDTQVYLQCPKVGVPRKRHKKGPAPTQVQVLSRPVPHEVRQLAHRRQTVWKETTVRSTERGELIAEFAIFPVWTLTEAKHVRREWLVIRRDRDGRLTYVVLNAPETTPDAVLIERSCQRYFTERAYQDAKSELGSADFQALKYRAVEHHMALTAAATWFIAETKLKWRTAYERDPELARQLEVDVLPALSTANVRELMQAVLPVPQLSPQQARDVVATHLVNRARSTASRLRTQGFYDDSG